jgi:hypothetical protein
VQTGLWAKQAQRATFNLDRILPLSASAPVLTDHRQRQRMLDGALDKAQLPKLVVFILPIFLGPLPLVQLGLQLCPECVILESDHAARPVDVEEKSKSPAYPDPFALLELVLCFAHLPSTGGSSGRISVVELSQDVGHAGSHDAAGAVFGAQGIANV